MNELEKESYDIMKYPKKYESEIKFLSIHRIDEYIYVCFGNLHDIGVVFTLTEEKKLKSVRFFNYKNSLKPIEFKVNKRPEIKEIFEELWKDYVKKYNLRIKLAIT